LGFLVFFVDQLSKYLVVRRFNPGETLNIIPGFFQLTYVRNYGAAFGILRYHTLFFIVTSFLMVLIIIFGSRYISTRYRMLRFALALLLGGTLGNLSDRVVKGYVVDFFDFLFWPVFNIADIAIVLGIAMVIFCLLRSDSFFQDHKR
jgi:signal peptidase II